MTALAFTLSFIAAVSLGASIHLEDAGMAAFNVCVFVMFIADAICNAIKGARK